LSNEETFKPNNEIKDYSLNDWMAVDESKFKNIFKNSPVKRIKHHRFMRNLAHVKESNSSIA
jgi:epoxyqueuosine reductase QueG